MSGRAGMLGRSCAGPTAPRAGGCLREEDEEGPREARSATPNRSNPMELMKVDPRALKENPDTHAPAEVDAAGRRAAAGDDQGRRHRPAARRRAGDRRRQRLCHRCRSSPREAGDRRRSRGDRRARRRGGRTTTAPCARWSRTSPAKRSIPSTSGARSNAWSRSAGPRRRSASRWRCRCARSGSCVCSRNVLPAMLDQMAKGDMPERAAAAHHRRRLAR